MHFLFFIDPERCDTFPKLAWGLTYNAFTLAVYAAAITLGVLVAFRVLG